MRARVVPALLLLALAAAACRGGSQAAEPPALPGSAPSLEALGEGVVEGFAKGDTARLRGYTLSREEFRDVVWPRLEVDTASGVTMDWSWRDNQMRGGRAYNRYIDRMKALPLRAVATRCTGIPDEHAEMTVLRGCTVTVRDGEGKDEEMRLFRSVVVIGGGHKIFRYDD